MVKSEIDRWESDFNKYLRERPRGRDALKRLLEEGCERRLIVALLETYALTKARRLPPFIRVTWSRTSKLAKQLQRHAQEVRDLNEDPLLSPLVALRIANQGRLKPDRTLPMMAKEFSRLPGMMVWYAAILETHLSILKKRWSERRVGREFFLVLLAAYVERMTGKPRHGELATLVEAAEFASGRTRDVSVEAIAKRIKRWRTRNPYVLQTPPPLERT